MTEEFCKWQGCNREPRMAVSVERPTRGVLKMITYYDDRTAPKKAGRYCKEHGIEFLSESCVVMVGPDEA